MTPTPVPDAEAMSPDQVAAILEYTKEVASGKPASPDLVTRMNSMGMVLATEKFRAQQVAASLNQQSLNQVAKVVSDYKGWGYPLSYAPYYSLHPMMWKVAFLENEFGGSYWAYVPDKPYDGVQV